MTKTAIEALREKRELNNEIIGDGFIHERFFRVLMESGLSVSEFSMVLKICETRIQEYLDGSFINFDIKDLNNLISYFKLNKDWFLYGKGDFKFSTSTHKREIPDLSFEQLQHSRTSEVKEKNEVKPEESMSELKADSECYRIFYLNKITANEQHEFFYEEIKEYPPLCVKKSFFLNHNINPEDCRLFNDHSDEMSPRISAHDDILVNCAETEKFYFDNINFIYLKVHRSFSLAIFRPGFRKITIDYLNPDYKKQEITLDELKKYIKVVGRVVYRSGDNLFHDH